MVYGWLRAFIILRIDSMCRSASKDGRRPCHLVRFVHTKVGGPVWKYCCTAEEDQLYLRLADLISTAAVYSSMSFGITFIDVGQRPHRAFFEI